MANTIGYGQGAVNNTNGFGKSATNNTIDFGEVCADSYSPETNLTGTGTGFSNTQSIELDGIDDYVEVADADNLSFGNGSTDSPFSISAWIKPTSAPFRIVFKWGTSTQEYYFQIAGGGKLQLKLQNGSAYIGKNANTTITLNTWHHVSITYDGSSSANGINVYLNSNNDNFNNITSGTYTAMSNTTEPFLIGRYAGGSSSLGKIDEVAIFDVELSSTEVTNIYNSGVPNDISSISGLVSWWRFEGTGTTATDSGSGGNDGVLDNTVVRSTDVPT